VARLEAEDLAGTVDGEQGAGLGHVTGQPDVRDRGAATIIVDR
jgi:hypothetical protein